MTDEEKKAIEMLDKFVTTHKLFNIKQSEGLEDNISIILNLIKKQSKMIDLMAEKLTSPINGKEWVIRYFKEKAEGIINE